MEIVLNIWSVSVCFKPVVIITAVVACLASLVRSTSADKIRTTVPLSAAVWTVNLRDYGYDDGQARDADQKFRLKMFHTDVSFLNDKEIVDTFVAFGQGPPGAEPSLRSTSLHAVVLDPTSGRVLRHVAWPTLYEASWLVPRADGSFVVFLGDRLEFYSADFEPRHALKLTPAPGHGRDDLWFSSSPSGKTILIQYKNGDHTSCAWVTGEALTAWQEKCDIAMESVVSDDEVATIERGKDGERVWSRISLKKFQAPWRTLCTGSGWTACNQPEFVTEDILLLWPGMHYMFRLANSDGKTTFFGPGKSYGYLYVNFYSQEAHLLAFPVWVEGEDTFPHVAAALVYDVSTRKRIFQVKNDEQRDGIRGLRALQGLAISPRGGRLVIQGDGILRCYDLPSGLK
jgi:hypothetical protein